MKDKIAKSVYWIVWSRGGIQTLSFISTLLVARLLAPSDYGVMALAGIWTMGVFTLAEMGLGAAIIQYRDLEDRDLNSCFWLTIGIAGIGYLGLFIAAPSIAAWFSSPMLSDVLRVVGLTLPLTALRIVPDSLLRKSLALDKVSQAEIAAAAVTIPVMVGLAWAGAGVWALVAAAIVGPLTQSVATFWFMHWWPGMQIGGARFREVVSYSGATLGSRICWMLREQADAFVLGKVSGDVVLGFYSMAKQLATLPVGKVSGVVNVIVSPMMAELQTSREALRAAFLRSLRLIACICLPVSIGVILVADDLIIVVLGQKWISVIPLLKVLCIYAIFSSIAVLLPSVMSACYRVRFMFQYTLVQLAVMPIAFWAAAIWGGALGVAIAWATMYPLALSWLAREAFREMHVTWGTVFAQFRSPAAASADMAVTLVFIRWAWIRWGLDLAGARLAVSVVLGATIYGTVLLWIGGPIREEIKEVLGWVFHGGRVALAAK